MRDTVIRMGRLVCVCLVVVLLAACSGGARRGGGYYLDDGPDANPPANLDAVPDAVPRIEPFAPSNGKPYVVFGKTYTPDMSGGPYRVQGRASWYGKNHSPIFCIEINGLFDGEFNSVKDNVHPLGKM